jgi:8-oxo-dGTP pyrophosphatase MutT (NUDIX family)
VAEGVVCERRAWCVTRTSLYMNLRRLNAAMSSSARGERLVLGQRSHPRLHVHSARASTCSSRLRRGERFLVVKRGPKAILSGYWAPPSGRIEVGESQEDALVREIEEELGLKATPVAKGWQCDTDDGDLVLHWWTAEIGADELRLDWTR